jgi:hypothetical protein
MRTKARKVWKTRANYTRKKEKKKKEEREVE